MRISIKIILIISSFMLLADMFLVPLFDHCYPATASSGKIFVGELPGNGERMRTFIVNSIMLQKLFPDLRNPRMPSVEDIGDSVDQYHTHRRRLWVRFV